VDHREQGVEGLSAVTQMTADMAASVRFYEALGFRLLYGGAGSSFSSFRVGSSFLNVQANHAWTPPGAVWRRVIFHVDDVDAMYTGLSPLA
jgi:catechol 2,3-dioxygenase-like lactoylglutathione lyase family enzyme